MHAALRLALAAFALVLLAPAVAAQADLVVTKTDAPDPVEAGADLTYTITVANQATGSGTTNRARNVVLSDTLPAGATFVSASTTRGSCPSAPTGGVLACSIGQLMAGQSATVTIVVRPSAEGTIGNTASATTTDPESPTTNNADTETTTVRPAPADLEVAKTVDDATVVEGDEVVFTVAVLNDGPGAARGVTLVDTLPAGLQFVDADPDRGTCEEEGGLVTCRLGDLADGATAEVLVTARALEVGMWENAAAANATNRDPDPGDEADTATVVVSAAPADLAVTKEASMDPAWVGYPLTFWVNVTNEGPGDAHDVTVVDALPVFVDVESVPAGCAFDLLGFLVCEVGTLDPDAAVSLAIVVTPTAAGNHTNVATVDADEDDPDADDDTAVLTVGAIPPPVELTVVKDDSADPVVVGDLFVYFVNVTNAGPGVADAVLVDLLPAEVALVDGDTGGDGDADCEVPEEGVVVCGIAGIPAGGTFELRLLVEAVEVGRATNVVEVSSGDDADDPSDNADTETTSILAERPTTVVDLVVTKTDDPDPVEVGEPLAYAIEVTNAGNATATNVTLVDALPDGVEVVSVDGSFDACEVDNATGTVTCSLATLAPGEDASVAIVVVASAEGDLVNEVVVVSEETDAAPEDNLDAETTTVGPAESTTPPAPTGLVCTAERDAIRLTWDEVAGADRYRVYRDAGEGFAQIASPSGTQYVDEDVDVGTLYTYRVAAVEGRTEGPPSATCEATAIPLFPTLLVGALAVVGGVAAYAMLKRRR